MARFTGQISPGIYFNVNDLTPPPTPTVSNTVAGIVTETLKGPAFEPILVSNYSEYLSRFGGTNPRKFPLSRKPQYEGSYIARQYLSQGSALWVTRVLGLSGYIDQSPAFVISGNIGPIEDSISISNLISSTTVTLSGAVEGIVFSSGATTGITYVQSAGTLSVSGNSYFSSGDTYFFVSGSPTGATFESFTSYTYDVFTSEAIFDTEQMAFAVLRSRGEYINNILTQNVTGVTISNDAQDNPLAQFSISASTSSDTFTYNVSFDATSRDYIGSVLSRRATDTRTQVWLEEVYPNSFRKVLEQGRLSGINTNVVANTTIGNWAVQYQTPCTPYIVSELRGNEIFRLFKFVSISDGTSANREIKITIQNIDLNTREFDVVIRDFNDTDNNVTVLETFSRCSMNPRSNGYIASRVGDGQNFAIQSRYVSIELAPEAEELVDAIPAGFEGYIAKNFADADDIAPPEMFYKTAYTQDDRITRTYLGVSENAYDEGNYQGTGIDPDRFNYNPANIAFIDSSSAQTFFKGFHMDSGVTNTIYASQFQTTPYIFQTDASLFGTPLESARARKFTLVPYGGFDGWDIYRTERTNSNSFREGQIQYQNSFPSFIDGQLGVRTSDYYAWIDGINAAVQSEISDINIFATPALDLNDNSSLINLTVDQVEDRGDILYIVNLPDLADTPTYAEEVVDIVDQVGIDSYLVATYAPWILLPDAENGGSIFLPPTAEVFRTLALTDNRFFPWFAPAGDVRGVTEATRARKFLREEDRETLYGGRVNPIITDNGTITIWGQRTLQVRESPLDRINVTRLIIQLQRILAANTNGFLFEQNNNIQLSRFTDVLNQTLQNVLDNQGITSFSVDTASVNDNNSRARNELNAQIYIVPTKAIERIIISLNVTEEGSQFIIT